VETEKKRALRPENYSGKIAAFHLFLAVIGLLVILTGRVSAEDIETERDVLFAEAGGIELKADIMMPEGEGPFPIVVAVHGGGFVRGDKQDIRRQCRRIASGGYVVFDANYRTMSMGVTFPAFVKDIHAAVSWVRKNAENYRGDPEKIGIMGFSAGAFIASLVAVTPHVKKLHHDIEGLVGIPSDVSALAAFYGHHDLTILDDVQRQTARLIWGGSVNEKLLRISSPANYIDSAVPTVLFHNTVDHLVPVEQSRSMYAQLKAAGVPAYYYEFPREAHDLIGEDEDWALGVAVKFFDRFLKDETDISLPGGIPREKLSEDGENIPGSH